MHLENYKVPQGLELSLLIYPVGLKHWGSVGFPFLVQRWILLPGPLLSGPQSSRRLYWRLAETPMFYLVHFCSTTSHPSSWPLPLLCPDFSTKYPTRVLSSRLQGLFAAFCVSSDPAGQKYQAPVSPQHHFPGPELLLCMGIGPRASEGGWENGPPKAFFIDPLFL